MIATMQHTPVGQLSTHDTYARVRVGLRACVYAHHVRTRIHTRITCAHTPYVTTKYEHCGVCDIKPTIDLLKEVVQRLLPLQLIVLHLIDCRVRGQGKPVGHVRRRCQTVPAEGSRTFPRSVSSEARIAPFPWRLAHERTRRAHATRALTHRSYPSSWPRRPATWTTDSSLAFS